MKLSAIQRYFSRLLLVSLAIMIFFGLQVFVRRRIVTIDGTVRDMTISQDVEHFHKDTALKNARKFLTQKKDSKDRIGNVHVTSIFNLTVNRKYFSKRSTAKQTKDKNIQAYITKSPLKDKGENSTNLVRYTQQQQQQHGVANSSEKAVISINDLLQPLSSSFLKINCSRLFLGDLNETLKAEKLRKTKPHKEIEPASYISATKHCEAFRLSRRYVNTVSNEERGFPLAYSILVHKSAEQFERLLRAIYRTHNYYCIHVDKKVTKDFFEAINAIVDCFPNVFIASKLEVVVYAGYTRLQADINCMEELYNNFSDWRYVLNMAASEFPLKTNLEMVQLLQLYNGSNLVGKNMKALNPGRWKNRYETVVNGLTGVIVKRNSSNIPPPFNLTMTKGSAYVILSRDMVDYVLNDPIPRTFLEWCKSTYSPDEQFWATLNNLEHNPHLNTPGGNRCASPSYMERAVMWYSKKCRGKLIRSVCVFGAGDLPWIQKRPEFIINKFDLKIDHVSYFCMEELLQQRRNNKAPWDLYQHSAYLKTNSRGKCGRPKKA